MAARYDAIGRSYTATRATDPRIAARVRAALGDARTVINVGAGTGSYEPADREVVAVEPSAVMRAQRAAGAAPAIDGRAEALVPEYLPGIASGQVVSFPSLAEQAAALAARVAIVPLPWDCADGFFSAFWRRPEAYLDPAVRAGISTLAELDDAVLEPALERLRADLADGAWARRHADLLELAELDLGYRLLVGPYPEAP